MNFDEQEEKDLPPVIVTGPEMDQSIVHQLSTQRDDMRIIAANSPEGQALLDHMVDKINADRGQEIVAIKQPVRMLSAHERQQKIRKLKTLTTLSLFNSVGIDLEKILAPRYQPPVVDSADTKWQREKAEAKRLRKQERNKRHVPVSR